MSVVIYKIYQKKLNQAGALDFGDIIMLMRTVIALRDNEAVVSLDGSVEKTPCQIHPSPTD
jgi:Na+(H+)/acetate symporter ActP